MEEVKKLGVTEIFGIPGDMIIKLFKLIEDDPDLKLCTFSHEPAVGFAAIGSARATKKPAVACITYGPGGLNMLNTVACAYAEKTPLIVVSGGPVLSVRVKDRFMHHMVRDFDSQLKVFREVTKNAVIIDDPATAKAQILAAISDCQEFMLPVYIELPHDIIDVQLPPSTPNQPTQTSPKPKHLDLAVQEIAQKMQNAKHPVIMVGVEADRFDLKEDIVQLAKAINVPVVSSLLARDLIPEEEPNYFGTYLSNAGNPVAKKLVDESDFLLLLGVILSDINFGARLAKAKGENMVLCFSRQVKSANSTYDEIPLKDVVAALCSANVPARQVVFPEKFQLEINRACKYTKESVVTGEIVDALNWFFSKFGEMPIISDTGNCLFATLKMKTSSVMSSAYYATMGFAVPASIGYALTTGKRPLVLIGDGGFQMTGQEICHCPRYDINPIFVVFNNRRWGLEQVFYTDARFNELVNWPYAKLADMWGGKGYVCDNCEKLYRALEDAKNQNTFTLIEAVTTKEELSDEVLAWIEEQKHQT